MSCDSRAGARGNRSARSAGGARAGPERRAYLGTAVAASGEERAAKRDHDGGSVCRTEGGEPSLPVRRLTCRG
eukprot:3294188-Pleurochrysis_carterae.AAC.1